MARGPAPEFDSFHRLTARSPAGADSGTSPPRPSTSPRTWHPATVCMSSSDGFEVVTLPNVVDGGPADLLARCHQPTTPMRHPLGPGAEGGIHDRLDLLRTRDGLATASGSHLPQTARTFLREAGTPQDNRVAVHSQISHDRTVGPPSGSGQYSAVQGLPPRRSISRHLLPQLLLVAFLEGQHRVGSRHKSRITEPQLTSYLLDINTS